MNNCLQSTIGDIKVNKALFPCSRSLLSVTWETSFSAKCYIKAWNEYHGYAPKEMNSSFNVLLTWGMRTQKWVHRGWSWGVGGRQSKAPSWGTSQAMRRVWIWFTQGFEQRSNFITTVPEDSTSRRQKRGRLVFIQLESGSSVLWFTCPLNNNSSRWLNEQRVLHTLTHLIVTTILGAFVILILAWGKRKL